MHLTFISLFFTCWISDNSPWSSKVLDKCETPEKDKNENHMSQNGSSLDSRTGARPKFIG